MFTTETPVRYMKFSTMTPEMATLKSRLRLTWMAGDYVHFATYLEPGALDYLARLQVEPDTRMLDVGCGAGQLSIPAARAGAHVTGIDIASNLIVKARTRAWAEALDAWFEEGDAESLPYEDGEFDLVVSLIGAMFAPTPSKVASELIRVCRSGGKIAMANWTPEGHVGQMFRVIGKHIPASPLMVSPMKWGDPTVVRDRFGYGVAELRMTKHLYPLVYPFPPEEVVEFYRLFYGPVNKAFASLDSAGQAALRSDLEELWTKNNSERDGSTHIEAEYLDVVAIRA